MSFSCKGSLAIYKLNGQSKPSLIREIKLFKDPLPISTTNDEDQTIIDSFTIYKFWIIVFKRKKNELHGAIYLFTHEGKLISNGKFPHTYPSRELTVDGECDRLWSLDQKQLCYDKLSLFKFVKKLHLLKYSIPLSHILFIPK